MYVGKKLSTQKNKLYGHLDKSNLARMVSIDELEIE